METLILLRTSSMKKSLLFLLLFTGMVKAQIVNIPDTNFKAKLLAADVTNQIASTATNATIPNTYDKIDINNDGEIQQSEAASVTLLDVSNSNIADLTGLEAFGSLHVLKCGGNQLTSLNIDPLNILVMLECENNNLTSLNIDGKIYLQLIFCGDNQLFNLTLSNLPSLGNLYCQNNHLTNLDVSSLPLLALFNCANNQLTALNVSNLVHLLVLECGNNFISTIDTDGLNSLQLLDCQNNQLTSLAVSSSADLTNFNCSNNQLTAVSYNGTAHFFLFDCSGNSINDLNISGHVTIDQLFCQNNLILTLDLSSVELLFTGDFTNNTIQIINIKNGFVENFANFNITSGSAPLIYICADDSELTQLNSYLFSAGLYDPFTTINEYCSFTPGGNYNTITGNIKFDADNDGCDGTDSTPTNLRVNISDGTNNGATFTNGQGNYALFTVAGNFDITPDVENQSWFDFSPATAAIPFADSNNNTAVQNFCVTANGVHPDLEIVIAPITPARPGFDAKYQIAYHNKGNQTLSGNITFTYDDATLDFVNSTIAPDAQNAGLLNWNYSDLQPFENRSFQITLHANTPTQTPALNIGDILNFEATITPVIADEIPADNLFAFHQTVIGSYDPNAITCLEGASVAPSEIGNYLHYMINFENTGTAAAENIVVKTEVDPANFDINSLQLINTSALVDARITGNTVEFIFKNIDLEIGGHGHILLKIKTNANLNAGDAVSKRADIFFDYNAPIDTGIADTVFQLLASTTFASDESIAIYPNPATNMVTIKAANNIKSIQLFDAQGRILKTSLTDDLETKFDISGYLNGMYLIKIVTDNGTKVHKLLKK